MSQMGYGIPTPNEDDAVVIAGSVEVSNDAGNPLPSSDADALAKLEAIRLLLATTLSIAGTVALDAGTLAALESINATISNFPADYPDAAVLAKVEQVRALLASTLTVQGTVTANQGAPGATPWPVDIGGATVSVSNLQQLSVLVPLSEINYDLDAAAYSGNAVFAQDSLLGSLALRFTTAAARNIVVSHSDGTVLWESTANTSLAVDVDFEDLAVDAGTTVSVDVTATTGACLLDVTFTAKIGTAALGGNPVLGEGGSHIGQVGLDVIDSPAGDAFGRLRVSLPVALFDTTHQYGISNQWAALTASGGTVTHRPAMSAVELGTTTTAGSSVKFQTRQYLRYQPGKSSLILASAVVGAPVANLRRRRGYFDDANGIFIEQNGTTDLAMVLRSSTSGAPVDTRVVQAAWNIDSLDGTGPSGIVYDPSKANLLVIDLQWLSVGRVRIGFDFGGLIVYCHQFLNANVQTVPYMTTANLPVRYEQANLGGAAAATMLAICAAVVAEGGHEPHGFMRSADTGVTSETVGATREPILSIRPAAIFGGLTNRGLIYPRHFDLLASGDCLWELVHQPTLTGAAWTAVGASSIVEKDTTATAITGGVVVASGYMGSAAGRAVSASDLNLERTILSLHPDGVTQDDVLTLAATSLGGNITAYGSLQWREEW